MKKGRLVRLLGGLALAGHMVLPALGDEPGEDSRRLLSLAFGNKEVAEQIKPASSENVSITDNAAACNTSCDEDQPGWLMQHLGGQCSYLGSSGINVGGWISQGYTWNPDRPRNRFNFPVTFNDRSNEYQMNQAYLFLEKAVATDGCCWDFGGRVDFMYGTDYYFTQATGLELEQDGSQRWNSEDGPRFQLGSAAMYGAALPQAYAEIFAPIGNGWNIKIGHFYTIIGYEVVPATGNFFYSHALTMQYGEPFTHTGVLGSTKWNDNVTINAGLTAGWDSFTNPDDNIGVLGGATYTTDCGRTSLSYAFHGGDEFDGARRDDFRWVQSVVLTQDIDDATKLVLQSDLGLEDGGDTTSGKDAEWYGLQATMIRRINNCLSAGLRAEWFRDDDHVRILGLGNQVEGGDFYEVTAGLNVKPYENLLIRPEVRIDWSDSDLRRLGGVGVYDDFSDKNQVTFGLDVIWSF